MARKIERIRQNIQSYQTEMAKRTAATRQLEDDLAELDRQRDAAIDQDDLATVEKLTRQRADLMIKLEARRAVDARKAEKGISRAEVAEAWNDDCKDYQKRVSAAQEEIIKALVTAAEKTKQLAAIATEGYRARQEAIDLCGVDDRRGEAADFEYPRFEARLVMLDYLKREDIQDRCPDLMQKLFQNPDFGTIKWMNG